MNYLAAFILRAFGIPKASEEGQAIGSAEEYGILFEHSRRAGTLNEDEHELLNRTLKLRDYTIEQLMVPRSEIDWIDINKPFDRILEQVLGSKHSSFLVANGELDKLLGFIRVRDILASVLKQRRVNLRKMIRQLLIVPANKSALEVLKDFQQSPFGLGVVLDEFGGVRGLFTVNDIVETAVGESPAIIEYEGPQYKQISENEWLMDGMISVEEFEELTGMAQLPKSRIRYHTLAGIILALLQHIPQIGETVEFAEFSFEVVSMDKHRIGEVRVHRLESTFAHEPDKVAAHPHAA